MTVNSRKEKTREILVVDQNGTVKYAFYAMKVSGIGSKLSPFLESFETGKGRIPGRNIDKRTLEKGPNFAKEWPKFTELDWQKEVEAYYELPAIRAENR